MFKRKEVSTYTFIDAISLYNEDYMDKDQRFVLDGLQLLGAMEDLKECELRILSLAKNESIRSLTRNDDIFREFDNADYYRIKINDIVSTIYMHATKIKYSEEELAKYELCTKKNITISDVTIPKTILISDYIPDFTFKITNLGFYGIETTDKVRVSLFNDSLDNKSEIEFNLDVESKDIGSSEIITVTELPCPKRQYEYNLKIDFLSGDKTIYSYIKPEINIVDRSRFYALQKI